MKYAMGSSMRIVQPFEHILAFYDGRISGLRVHAERPNWLDNGAFSLGTASFAVIDGPDAIVYDTHMSLAHARRVRAALEARGVTKMTVVLSHWHPDHIAGNAVFADCEIIANTFTGNLLEENQSALERGDPPIDPIILPTRLFEEAMTLTAGRLTVELRRFDIHSIDQTVIRVPEHRTILAGDTLEDTVTYVTEADRLEYHLVDLKRLKSWDFDWILPCHGTFEKISVAGYDKRLITAMELYIKKLIALRRHPEWADQGLAEFAAESLASGAVEYFEPYESVHRDNVNAILNGAN
jgi:glyoxylase-like metal-dependent hydrolase (beta-lactamase superfamily II)